MTPTEYRAFHAALRAVNCQGPSPEASRPHRLHPRMNMKFAEEVALDAESRPPLLPRSARMRAFAWADRKQHDARVSGAFQDRAASVARRLWAAAGHR